MAVMDALKGVKTGKRESKSSQTVVETWAKKGLSPTCNAYSVKGKYQPPPKKPMVSMDHLCQKKKYGKMYLPKTDQKGISDFVKTFVGMDNLGFTCWLNSAVQALRGCNLGILLLETENISEMFRCVINVISKLRRATICSKSYLAKKKLMPLFVSTGDKKTTALNSQFKLNEQQDVHEFFSLFLQPVIDLVNPLLHFDISCTCFHCHAKKKMDDKTSVLLLDIPSVMKGNSIHVQHLVDSYFSPREQCDYGCGKCGATGGMIKTNLDVSKPPP